MPVGKRTPSGSGTPLLMDAGSPVEGAKRKLSVDERRQRTMSKHQVSKMRALFEKYLTGQNAALTLALVVLVLARTCDQTLYYRLNFSYQYFVWYFASVILAVPISFIVVWYKMLFTKDITPEMRAFPQYKFAIMALFDTSFNIFSTFPVQHLGGDLSNALAQSILPVNMIGSFFFLKTRFKKVHYWGAILVFYGILVRLSPSLGTPAFGGSFWWIMLTFLSQAPSAASNVYKELALKGEVDLDVWYANAWVGVYQLLWGIASVWTIFIPPFVAPHPPLGLKDVPTFLSNANKCFVGQNVDVFTGANTTSFSQTCIENPNNIYDQATEICHVDCHHLGAPITVFSIYILFNLTYNVLALYVFKYGSSVLFVVVNAVRLPLVDGLNTVKFVSGQASESFGKYDGFALFILVMAIFVYYSEEEDSTKLKEARAKSTDGGVPDLMPSVIISPRISAAAAFRHRDSRAMSSDGYTQGARGMIDRANKQLTQALERATAVNRGQAAGEESGRAGAGAGVGARDDSVV